MKTLPKTPSKLLALALKDLRAVERHPSYAVNMGVWHAGAIRFTAKAARKGKVRLPCEVCLAGAVMAQSLNVAIDEDKYVADYPVELQNPLLSLDSFRCGHVYGGLNRCGIPMQKYKHLALPTNIKTVDYAENRAMWHEQMEGLLVLLQQAGL